MGTGILEANQKALDFTLPDALTGTDFTLSAQQAKQNIILIFFRGLW